MKTANTLEILLLQEARMRDILFWFKVLKKLLEKIICEYILICSVTSVGISTFWFSLSNKIE